MIITIKLDGKKEFGLAQGFRTLPDAYEVFTKLVRRTDLKKIQIIVVKEGEKDA